MLTSFDVPTSAAVPYKELHARAGYPPSRRRTPSPLKMPADSDQVREDTARGLDELKPEDTVPALFSSPKYAVFEGDRGETVKSKQNCFSIYLFCLIIEQNVYKLVGNARLLHRNWFLMMEAKSI